MLSELLKRPVIPVIVIEDAGDAEPLAEAVLAGGMDVIEVTCRTAAAPEALARIKKAFPDMLLGAGTVVTPEQARMCIDTGVDFGLAPGLNPDTVKAFRDSGTLYIPGIMTPSEIEHGLALGCTLLKFFPAGAAGGVAMLKNLAAPYAPLGVTFCPTGGVNLENMNDYLSLPVVSAVGGSWLATKQQIADKQWDVITQQVKDALAKAREVIAL
ncbi:MAG: bifunctional 4-hydroxy-2-oxoglutarate aldolase/2-dehydro-3-deoxy-phosphogluconate aldolase [Kiritimatiellia bacterium]|jgi:2-dehydro-3-deoxyphosphogluconate aldolase/(4S)-4-hydroxy-2-oxoglutarate aldolase|nr:bifunctional 4-hydroxy-2-oxoglutarate aldolase/2-dehydro-3-deoxy-phosphogluconate aldolase [Kiritimatiellia bacterium]MDP6811335.1 bifunctional 4-hydroxy-2-oxoglutarate aldolase/2-dehydro-3-deoxy-phosphogluconate aldolase [Kiritimatiellia bacterium]MDP7024376.1 bifunctional 4-hydroxy-2-oxoglutarate aldolase/2-dehydro-3-deoxy-phosphogluconate aldolase [Kiritimatiellia bacterium]